MQPPNLLARIRASRRTSLLVFAATLAALVVTAIWFNATRSQLARAYQQVDAQGRALAEAHLREREATLAVDYARSADRLLDEVQRRGLTPQQWGERLVRLNQVQMNREESVALLASLGRDGQRLFGARTFEVAVTTPGDGLFTAPAWSERGPAPLQLSIDGNLLFRTDVLPGPALAQPVADSAATPASAEDPRL